MKFILQKTLTVVALVSALGIRVQGKKRDKKIGVRIPDANFFD